MLFSNPDRVPGNWGIINLANGMKRVCILDHEFFFNRWKRPNKIYFKSDYLATKYDDLKFFLEEADTEFVNLFLYYFNLITPLYFQKLLKEVAKENSILPTDLEQILKIYQENYQKIDCVIRGIEYGRK